MDASERIEQIEIVLFEGFEELDALGPYAIFATAADFGADLSVKLCTLNSMSPVRTSHEVDIEPQGTLSDDADLILIPGGGWDNRDGPGTWAEVQRGDLPIAIARQYGRGAITTSVCTGGLLLASGGLLDDRPATTHKSALDDLRDFGVDVIEARVVDDGDVLTAAGVISGLDLALWIIKEAYGPDIEDAVTNEIEYYGMGEVYTGD